MKSILIITLLNFSSYNSDISTIRELYLAAYTSESHCNSFGEKLGAVAGVTAVTDVTGFGLLGHLIEMAQGSSLSAVINYSNIINGNCRI